MESLKTFGLQIPVDHVVVVFYPTKDEVTTIIMPNDPKAGRVDVSRPCVVASANLTEETQKSFNVERGDLVYIKGEFVHSAMKLEWDSLRKQNNPIIMPVYAIGAVLTETEAIKQFCQEFDELAQRQEVAIAEKEARLKKVGNK